MKEQPLTFLRGDNDYIMIFLEAGSWYSDSLNLLHKTVMGSYALGLLITTFCKYAQRIVDYFNKCLEHVYAYNNVLIYSDFISYYIIHE